MRRGAAARVIAALVLTGASVAVQRSDAAVAVYGSEGGSSQVRLRVEGGWPAVFLADDPVTSVPYRLGVEDVFAPAPFIADVAFWYLAIGAAWWFVRRITAR